MASLARYSTPRRLVCMLLTVALASAADSAALAGDRAWSFRFSPLQLQASGHDQHVLTIDRFDSSSASTINDREAVTLATDSGPAYRGEFRYSRGAWGWGIDVFWFATSQDLADLSVSSASGDLVVFETTSGIFSSTDPAQELFFGVLEDTDLALWTFDLYATRRMAETSATKLDLLFGLRNGDFDNDFRAVVGVRDRTGARLDASSNYGRMMGPLIGLTGELTRGRNSLRLTLSQSVLLGSAELSRRTREFNGPLEIAFPVDVELPEAFADVTFRADQDVAIPVSELRFDWTYDITSRLAIGLGGLASTWWDVSVPPGVIPAPGGDDVLHENTIVLFGLMGTVEVRF